MTLRLVEDPLGEDARPLTPQEGAALLDLWEIERRRPVRAYSPAELRRMCPPWPR